MGERLGSPSSSHCSSCLETPSLATFLCAILLALSAYGNPISEGPISTTKCHLFWEVLPGSPTPCDSLKHIPHSTVVCGHQELVSGTSVRQMRALHLSSQHPQHGSRTRSCRALARVLHAHCGSALCTVPVAPSTSSQLTHPLRFGPRLAADQRSTHLSTILPSYSLCVF